VRRSNLEKRYAPLYARAVRIRPVRRSRTCTSTSSRRAQGAGVLTGDDILERNTRSRPWRSHRVDQLDKGTRANMASLLDELGTA